MARRRTGSEHWIGRGLAVLGLLGLLLVAFARLVVQPQALLVDGERPSVDHARPAENQSVGNDLTRLFLPHHQRIARALAAHGRVPGWDPAGFGGRPLVGNPQAGLWYPPVWIAWWVGHPAALGWITLGHLLAAGLGSYRLARLNGLGHGPALVAGGAFELSPYLLGQTFEGHYPHVWAVAWYPWAFASALRLLRDVPGGGLGLPPILALALLSGHAQEGYYLVLALGLWTGGVLVERLWCNQGRPADLVQRVGAPMTAWLVLGGLTVGLTAIEWWPGRLAGSEALRGQPPTVGQASHYHLVPEHFLQLLHPDALGGRTGYFGPWNDWETRLSFGALALGLALVAAVRSERRRAVVGWGLMVLLAVAFAGGREAGLFPVLFQVVPGMDRFRAPSRALFLAALGLAQLAGLGLEALARPVRWRGWSLGALGLAVVELLGLASLAWAPGLGRPSRAARNLLAEPWVWLVILTPAVVLAALQRWPAQRHRIAGLVGALTLAELLVLALTLIRVAPAGPFLDPDALARAIACVAPDEPYRIRARDAFLDDAAASAWGLEKTNIDDLFQLQRPSELYQTLYPLFGPPRPIDLFDPVGAWYRQQAQQAVLDRMNVALLVTDRPLADAPWPVASEGQRHGVPFVIYRNPTALPRAYVVPGVAVAPDDADAVVRLGFLPGAEVVLLPVDPLAGVTGPRQPFTPAQYRALTPDRVQIQVRTEAPGLLVVADTASAGWTATLDGRPAPILTGNRAQRVLVLPGPGQHTVVMTYQPPGLAAGRALTLLATALWLLLVITRARRMPVTGPGATAAARRGGRGAPPGPQPAS